MNDYERLRELAEKATPGPWTAQEGWVFGGADSSQEECIVECSDPEPFDEKNAAFIAAANPDAVLNLLEDLRLTRQERDQEKHKCMEARKDNALLHRALEAVEGYVGRLEHERAALRRGQGTAPAPAAPEHPPFHHTHPIPDSTKGDQ